MLVPVSAGLSARIRSADGATSTRDAATIALVRQGPGGIEAFMMRRHAQMKFAPGQYVFPGGAVTQSDFDPLDWIGPPREYWAQRFNCGVELAGALVVAVVRETFEESGVLLAGTDDATVVGDVSTSDFAVARVELESEKLSFAQFLNDSGLVLRADLLGAWAHWITPSFEPKRYDTRFFVAHVPQGQVIESVNGEADHADWVPLTELLDGHRKGEVQMLLPTATTCQELVNCTASTVSQLAETRTITAIEPRVVEIDGKLFFDTGREDQL